MAIRFDGLLFPGGPLFIAFNIPSFTSRVTDVSDSARHIIFSFRFRRCPIISALHHQIRPYLLRSTPATYTETVGHYSEPKLASTLQTILGCIHLLWTKQRS